MNPAGSKWVAAVVAGLIAVAGAALLLFIFSAVRYRHEVVINIVGLFLLTVICAVPGALLMLFAAVTAIAHRKVAFWVRAGAVGAIAASLGAAAMAFAADCVPHCKGARGSIGAGVALAIPAGFAIGVSVFAIWKGLYNRINSRLVAKGCHDV
jgi:kynureninase